VDLKRKVTRVRNQVEGLLEQGGIKLSSVASDVFGVSGWAMLERIAAGETDIDVIVGQARAGLRKKKTELEEALAGHLEPVYRMLLKQYMDQVRLLRQQIGEIHQALAAAMKEHAVCLYRLCQIPGIQMDAAQELLAEIGPKAAAFASPERFASWVGVCPGSQESAGVCYSHRSAKGNRYLRRLLCQIAWGAIHTRQSFFAGLFGRLLPRLDSKGAAWAVAHRLAKVIWLVLHQGMDYREKGPAPQNVNTLFRKLRRLTREFAAQGIDVSDLLSSPANAATT
jgi:transposase